MKEEQINPWALNLDSRKKWWMNLLHWQFNWVQIMNQMFSCLPRPYPPKTLQTVLSDTGISSSSLWNQLADSHDFSWEAIRPWGSNKFALAWLTDCLALWLRWGQGWQNTSQKTNLQSGRNGTSENSKDFKNPLRKPLVANHYCVFIFFRK